MTNPYQTPDSWDAPQAPEPRRERPRILRKDWWQTLWTRVKKILPPWGAHRMSLPPPDSPLPMPTPLQIREPDEDFTIETPALGDAFNFTVRVRCSWHVQATATQADRERKTAEVRTLIEETRATARQRVEERVRPIARQFAPYRAAEAEVALNQQIVDCLSDGDVRATVRIWVDVSDPVREDLQKVWRDRLTVDAVSDLRKANVQLLGELQEAWGKLLTAGLEGMGAVPEAKTGWMAPYALALAQDPEHAAAYLKDVLEGRVSHAEKLLAALGTLAIDDRFEAVEFAFQSESALRSLLMYLGVPVPGSAPQASQPSQNGAGSHPIGGLRA